MQYYHTVDPLEDLRLRVRLRKLQGPKIQDIPQSKRRNWKHNNLECEKADPLHEGNKSNGYLPLKIGSEVTAEVRWQQKLLGPQELLSSANSKSKPAFQKSARKQNTTATHERHQIQDESDTGIFNDVMIFTYTDKDGYMSPDNARNKLMNTKKGQYRTALEEAACNLPLVSNKGGLGGLSSVQTRLGTEAEVVAKWLVREGCPTWFYVMAAVDIRDPSLTKGKRLHAYEKCLLAIKAHPGGGIQFEPGLSEERDESGDEGAYDDEISTGVKEMEGPRLVSHWFITPEGSIYEYTVENRSALAGGVEAAEKWAIAETMVDQQKIKERNEAAGLELIGAPPLGFSHALHIYMEIVSAHGFNSRNLRVLWELLPSGWILAPHTNHGNKQSTPLRGAMQTAMTTILRAPRSTSSPPTTEIPLGVYKSTTSSRVMVLGLVVLLVLTLLTNLSWIWWMLLAIVLLIGDVTGIIGVSGKQVVYWDAHETAHFGLLSEFHLVSNVRKDEGMLSSPKVVLEVMGRYSLDRKCVEGYGHITVPPKPGNYDFQIKTWRPKGCIRDDMMNFFLGGSNTLSCNEFVASSVSRYGLRSCGGGEIRVRLGVTEQFHPSTLPQIPPSKIHDPTKGTDRPMTAATLGFTRIQDRSIREIIDSVKANRDRISRKRKEVNGLGSKSENMTSQSPSSTDKKNNAGATVSPSPKAVLESLRAQIDKSKLNELQFSKSMS